MLVCRTYFKLLKKCTFTVNYEYRITAVNEHSLVLDATAVIPLAVALTSYTDIARPATASKEVV